VAAISFAPNSTPRIGRFAEELRKEAADEEVEERPRVGVCEGRFGAVGGDAAAEADEVGVCGIVVRPPGEDRAQRLERGVAAESVGRVSVVSSPVMYCSAMHVLPTEESPMMTTFTESPQTAPPLKKIGEFF
jgi:hypothetical protein